MSLPSTHYFIRGPAARFEEIVGAQPQTPG